jgi:hypothetical protein
LIEIIEKATSGNVTEIKINVIKRCCLALARLVEGDDTQAENVIKNI